MFLLNKEGQTALEYLLLVIAGITFVTLVFVSLSGWIGSTNETILMQGDKIIITLFSPNNNSYAPGEINFDYTVSSMYPLIDCNLWIGEDNVLREDNVLVGQTNQFVKSFNDEGEYEWSVSCKDNKNNFVKANSKKFFIVERTNNVIVTLHSPDETEHNIGAQVFFNYTPTPTNAQITHCNLIVEGETRETSNNIIANNRNSFVTTFSEEDFISNWELSDKYWNVDCYTSGGGSGFALEHKIFYLKRPSFPPEQVYLITTCEELQAMENNLRGHYALMNDIDCSQTRSWDNTSGFKPIGSERSFVGTLNGNNYKIKYLHIHRPATDNVGLFGSLGGAIISNVGLEDANISGRINVGGIAGKMQLGKIINSYNIIGDGKYSYAGVMGQTNVGGLIGNGYLGEISGSYNGLKVSGNESTGGIVGHSENVSISNSYNFGGIFFNGSEYNAMGFGGISGHSLYNSINDSNNFGKISGQDYVGGISGFSFSNNITNSSNHGRIVGKTRVGGISGENSFALLKKVYNLGDINSIGSSVGGIAGQFQMGSISQAFNLGDINGSSRVGGIVGGGSNGKLEDVYNKGVIFGNNFIGGIIGDVVFSWQSYGAYMNVKNAYNVGDIYGLEKIGGLSGRKNNFYNSYSTGKVTGVSKVGGVLGERDSSTVNFCGWYKQSEGNANYAIGDPEGSVTYEESNIESFYDSSHSIYDTWFFERNVDDMGRSIDFKEPVWFFDGEYPRLSFELDPGVDVYNVFTCFDLQDIKNNLGKKVILRNNINCTQTKLWNCDMDGRNCKGFEPIGKDYIGLDEDAGTKDSFYGVFEGGEYVISNLYINRPDESYVGLFGGVNRGKIFDLTLVNANISGKDYVGGIIGEIGPGGHIHNSFFNGIINGNVFVGGIVGRANGSVITNSYNGGNIFGNGNVGGLVGVNDGVITNSYNGGNIFGNNSVGGLVGVNVVEVTNSYNGGNIFGSGSVGGIAGSNYSSIANAYNIGVISGETNVGGIIGYNHSIFKNIINSYSTGRIVSNSEFNLDKIGGLIGGQYYSRYSGCEPGDCISLDSCGWYKQVDGNAEFAVGSGSKNAEYLESNVSNFYDSNHDIYDDSWSGEWYWSGNDFPILREVFYETTNNTEISNCHQLQEIKNNLGGSFILLNDIDCTGIDFTPIGNINNNFIGTLDGNNFIIKNLTINSTNDYVGLFAVTKNALIKNVGLKDVDISGKDYVGGIVGKNDGGVLEKVFVTGNVDGIMTVGGIVGVNFDGLIEFSYNTAKVSADYYVGGITGENNNGYINYSFSIGEIFGNYGVGGLVGENFGNLVDNGWYTQAGGDAINPIGDGFGIIEYETDTLSDFYNSEFEFYDNWSKDEWYWSWTHNKPPQLGSYTYSRYPIQECRDFDYIKFHLNDEFVLLNDIDCSGINFIPVEGNFNGTLEGNNFVITNLTSTYGGLFTQMQKNAVIKNIGLINVQINKSPSYSHVGGIVGINSGGLIENVFVTGEILQEQGIVGGIVGVNSRSSDYYPKLGIIQNSYFDGKLMGESVGGIVGQNWGQINNSFSTGEIDGKAGAFGTVFAGGVIGKLSTDLSNLSNLGWYTQAGGDASSAIGSPIGSVTYEESNIESFYDSSHSIYDTWSNNVWYWSGNGLPVLKRN